MWKKNCPSCGTSEVRRSAFSDYEERDAHIFRSPYRCEKCGERFWVVSRKARRLFIWTLFGAVALVTFAFLIPEGAPPQRPSAQPSGDAIVQPHILT